MTIQRQYSLPNCTLILEGMSADGSNNLSILLNAECRFSGVEQKLKGDRVLIDSLITAVNAYAQQCLSGLHHPQELNSSENAITLETDENNYQHHLTWRPPGEENSATEPVEIKLTTVQLFDLVEAVDQLVADNLTLPDLQASFQPLSRRYRNVEEPIVQRVTPPAIGLASIALVGMAFFMTPVPEIPEPKIRSEENTTETLPTPPTNTEEPTTETLPTPPTGEESTPPSEPASE